jgi:Tfp pilus assembly protein PilN
VLIEINLAPGASGAGKRRSKLSIPALPNLGGDLRMVAAVAAALVVLGVLGFGYWHMSGRQVALEADIQREVTDSTRFAATIALLQSVQARQDTITQKINVIRSVDDRRYVWPHLLEEISFAVPAFTWLSQISSTEAAGDSLATGPSFTIQGNAGSTQALTRFMKNLESSPFVRDVMLITTEQEVVDGRTIQRFSLEANYRAPDSSAIQTYPIIALD